MSFLIDDVRVLTMNAAMDSFEHGCVAVEGKTIVAVGDRSSAVDIRGSKGSMGTGESSSPASSMRTPTAA